MKKTVVFIVYIIASIQFLPASLHIKTNQLTLLERASGSSQTGIAKPISVKYSQENVEYHQANKIEVVEGGIIRGNKNKKELSLVFTGHDFADGAEHILNTLDKNNVKGTFFLTGHFYRKYPIIVKELQEAGHYMGPHSDMHLLYADWENRDSTLVTKDEFIKDLQDNYDTMTEVGLKVEEKKYFMPPYEWYNQEISNWANEMGVQIVNFTPGTTSNADYTTPDMSNYRSSKQIYESILSFEEKDTLNGMIMLIHIGTDPARTDKLYNKLDHLIIELKNRGYKFLRIDELLQ